MACGCRGWKGIAAGPSPTSSATGWLFDLGRSLKIVGGEEEDCGGLVWWGIPANEDLACPVVMDMGIIVLSRFIVRSDSTLQLLSPPMLHQLFSAIVCSDCT